MNSEEIKKDLLETGGFAKMQHHYRGYFNNDLDYFNFCLTNLFSVELDEYVKNVFKEGSTEILVRGLNESENNRLWVRITSTRIMEGEETKYVTGANVNISYKGKELNDLEYHQYEYGNLTKFIPHFTNVIIEWEMGTWHPIKKEINNAFGNFHYMTEDSIVYTESYTDTYSNSRIHRTLRKVLKEFKEENEKLIKSHLWQRGAYQVSEGGVILYHIKNQNEKMNDLNNGFYLFRIKEIADISNIRKDFIDLEVTYVDKDTLMEIDPNYEHNVGILEHTDY